MYIYIKTCKEKVGKYIYIYIHIYTHMYIYIDLQGKSWQGFQLPPGAPAEPPKVQVNNNNKKSHRGSR